MRSAYHASAGTARRSTQPLQQVEFTFWKAWTAEKHSACDAGGSIALSRHLPTAMGDAAS